MRTTILYILICFGITQTIYAQSTIQDNEFTDKKEVTQIPSEEDSASIEKDSIAQEKQLFMGVDFTNRYVWRGQAYGGRFFAIQPYVEYAISDKLMLGIWGTSNFKRNVYLYNQYGLRGYKELEPYLIYTVNDYLSLSLHDYYTPINDQNADLNNNFFYYGKSSAKTLDVNINFDFSEKGFPLSGILSTYVAGNDHRYNSNDKNPKKNFTTYIEVSYTIEDLLENFEIISTAGAVLNNAAQSYVNADYDKPSFVNLGVSAIKTFELTNTLSMPVSLSYTHNAATANTEFSGRNFFQGTLSLVY